MNSNMRVALYFCSVSLLLLLVSAGAAAQTLTTQYSYPVTTSLGLAQASDIVSGNFSSRTGTDIVVVGYPQRPMTGIAVLQVIPLNSDGTFQPPISQPVKGTPKKIAKGDFDGDGHADIAILTDGDDDLQIFLGKGDGTFLPVILNSTLSPGFDPILLAGDFNLDGKTDLIARGSVLVSNGNGSFRVAQSLGVRTLAAGNFRGSGVQDLVTTVDDPTVITIYTGLRDGTFVKGQSIRVLPGLKGVTAGDLDGNGSVDLAVDLEGVRRLDQPQLPTPANIAVFLNDGTGVLNPAPAATGYGSPLIAIDFDRDKTPDLVSGNTLLRGLGKGRFSQPSFLRLSDVICQLMISARTCAVNTQSVAAVDLTQTGMSDLVFELAQTQLQDTILSVLKQLPGTSTTIQAVSSATGSLPVGPRSLISLFGTDLAPASESASTSPFPTTLGGVRVHLRYTNGSTVLAPLLYVSPTQINLSLATPQNPAGDYIPFLPEYGAFTGIGIERVGVPFQETAAAMLTQPLVPALFSLNSSGLAAATAVRVSPSGQQSVVPLFQCDAIGCSALPVDVSGDPVYVSLYGTGFEVADTGTGGLRKPIQVSCGGTTPVYVGPQNQIPGLDQINFVLKPTQTGSQNITCLFFPVATPTVAPISSNTVFIVVK